MTEAAQIIWREHANISRVLECLRGHLATCEERGAPLDTELLNAIVYYMEGFADTLHHPKEEHYLLPALVRRQPDLALLVEKVQEEHKQGADLLADLRRRLVTYRRGAESVAAVREAAETYIEFQLRHMAREDQGLMPLALEVLSEEDWADLNEAFRRNEDPLFGAERQERFVVLFDAILAMAPE